MSDPWERRPKESPQAYQAFRMYRDSGSSRNQAAVVEGMGVAEQTVKNWSSKHNWRERALAWDDECARVEDRQRLDNIRTMYDQHRRVGRVAIAKALAALQQLPADHIPAGAAARLLELGIRVERQTLSTTPEDFLGVRDDTDVEDAFAALARELLPAAS